MVAVIIDEKRCRVCGEYYPIDFFNRRHKGQEDRVNICRDCLNASRRMSDEQRAEKAATVKVYRPEDPWHDLACAVLVQAVRDWQNVRRIHKYSRAKRSGEDQRHKNLLNSSFATPLNEMCCFFWSDWYEELCGMAGYDPEWIRERLRVPRMLG